MLALILLEKARQEQDAEQEKPFLPAILAGNCGWRRELFAKKLAHGLRVQTMSVQRFFAVEMNFRTS